MVLNAVDTTSVSRAAINEPMAVRTTTHLVVALVLICVDLQFMSASLVGPLRSRGERNSPCHELRSDETRKSIGGRRDDRDQPPAPDCGSPVAACPRVHRLNGMRPGRRGRWRSSRVAMRYLAREVLWTASAGEGKGNQGSGVADGINERGNLVVSSSEGKAVEPRFGRQFRRGQRVSDSADICGSITHSRGRVKDWASYMTPILHSMKNPVRVNDSAPYRYPIVHSIRSIRSSGAFTGYMPVNPPLDVNS